MSNVVRIDDYRPCRACRDGIEVCRLDETGKIYTEATYTLPPSSVRDAFGAARSELEAGDADENFLVNLIINGGIADDMFIWREMLPRLAEIVSAFSMRAEGD